MKKRLHLFGRCLLMSLFLVSLVANAAIDYKPYPVYFSLGDYPEFKAIKGWRNPAANGTWIGYENMTSVTWTSNYSTDIPKMYNNCKSIGYYINTDNVQKYPAVTTYGDYLSLSCSYNRANTITFKLPWMNPGQYRVYINTFSTQTGNNAYRGCAIASTVLDGTDTTTIDVPAWIVNSAGERTIGGVTNGNGIALGGYKDSAEFMNPMVTSKFAGAYINTKFYCGQIVIKEAGIHTFTIVLNEKDGLDLGFDMLSLIPVTATDMRDEYVYPKFDIGGNVYLNSEYAYSNYTGGNHVYQMASLDSSLIIDEVGASMGVLPFQVTDPTNYGTTYEYTLNAGTFFNGKNIAVLRSEDKWTRVFTGVVENGKAVAKLPAGSYYCEVNNIDYAGLFTVTGTGSLFVGTQTADVTIKYNADPWYVGKSLKVYSADGSTLYGDYTIKSDGTIDVFPLPLGDYYYVVGESADKASYFEQHPFSVLDETPIVLDNTAAKYTFSVKAGNDAWVTNADYQVYCDTNVYAVFADAKLSADGNLQMELPNGNYIFALDNGFLYKAFTINDAATTIDMSGRYAANLYPGVILNGYLINVYKDDSLYVGQSIVADGKASVSGLSDGFYTHDVWKDTFKITQKIPFNIEGADAVIGDAANLNQPYIIAKAVFFDLAQQPEIVWQTDIDKVFNAGDLAFVEMPKIVTSVVYEKIDSSYNAADSVWTYVYDSTKIVKENIRDNFIYRWGGTTTDAKNAYVNGDYIELCFNGTDLAYTFTTPIINKGRYNIYISSRYNGATKKPVLDSIFVDGKLTSVQGVSMNDYNPATPYRRSVSMSKESSWGNILDAYLGWVDIEETGRHKITLKSINGGSQNPWFDMLKFIPVAEDAEPQGGEYYPLFDICGYPSEGTASTGNNDLGVNGVNHIFAPWQAEEQSIYKNENADYTTKLSLTSGVYGAGDQLSLCSVIDNWTHYEYQADTISGNIDAQSVIPGVYAWQTLQEGIVGKYSLDLTKDYKLSVPETLESKMVAGYNAIPSEDDEELGTIDLTVIVSLKEAQDFFYPITGAVSFYEFDALLKTDTLYKASNGKAQHQIPDYILADLTPENFQASYSGNFGRLQACDMQPVLSLSKNGIHAGIYPNPANEYIHITVAGEKAKVAYRLYNQLGQVVRNGSFAGNSATIGLEGVSRGYYILQVESDGMKQNTKLLVK